METNEQIIGAITNIKVSGIATMSYWSILKTVEAMYFVKSGSALGLGIGTNAFFMLTSVIGDVIESQRAKGTSGKDLATVLSEAEQYFRFGKEQFGLLDVSKSFFGGGTVEFSNGQEKSWRESGKIDLPLSRKQYKIFLEMLNN